MLVWLRRFVRVEDSDGTFMEGTYFRAIDLPIPPFVDMGICINQDDPVNVEGVFITLSGAIVVDLPNRVYGGREHYWGDGESVNQFEYETDGWRKCEGNEHGYELLVPQPSDVTPWTR